jgi:hypothetical protein
MTRRNHPLSYAAISLLVLLMCMFYVVMMLTLIPPLVGASAAVGTPVNSMYPGSDVVNAVVLNVLFALTLCSFLQASFTQPGSVPRQHPFDPDSPVASAGEFSKALAERGFELVRGLERKHDGRARFCRVCGVYKPDRTHHSSNVGQCVLEMDHYCPWIRNCVGYRNKKFFFLLISYGAASLIAYVVALAPRFLFACERVRSALDFFIVFSWILALLLGAALTIFSAFHAYLIATAYTTIEFCEKRSADESKRTVQGLKVNELYGSSPYDLGLAHNVKHVLGPWYLALLPVRWGMPDDVTAGCVFDVNKDHPMYKALWSAQRAPSAIKLTKQQLDAADAALLASPTTPTSLAQG